VCEVAVATHTQPSAWWDEDEATLMTVVAILDEVHRAQERALKGSSSSKTKRGEGDDDGGS